VFPGTRAFFGITLDEGYLQPFTALASKPVQILVAAGFSLRLGDFLATCLQVETAAG
jgi:hypothetical protein